jgi:hypothetical protein
LVPAFLTDAFVPAAVAVNFKGDEKRESVLEKQSGRNGEITSDLWWSKLPSLWGVNINSTTSRQQ